MPVPFKWVNPPVLDRSSYSYLVRQVDRQVLHTIEEKGGGGESSPFCIVLLVFPSTTYSSLSFLVSGKSISQRINLTQLEPPKSEKVAILKKTIGMRRCMKTLPSWLFIPKIECLPISIFLAKSKT